MNRDQFLKYLNRPEELSQESLNNLQELLSEFPYFQTGHLLLLKNLHNVKSIRFENQLKVSSVFAHDRSVLYTLLHVPTGKEVSPYSAETKPEAGKASGTLAAQAGEEDEAAEPREVPYNERVAEKEDEASEIPEQEPVAEEEKDEAGREVLHEEQESVAERIMKQVEEAKKRREEGVLYGKKDNAGQGPGPYKDREPQEEGDLFVLTEEADEASPGDKPDETPDLRPATGEILEIDEREEEPQVNEPEIKEKEEKKEKRTASSLQPEPPDSATPEKKTQNENRQEASVKSNSHSFSQWIDMLSNEPDITPSAEEMRKEDDDPPVKRQHDLIDRFLEKEPRIVPRDEKADEAEDISRDSVEESEGLFTDTLAQIYIRQGYYSKAIFAYEKLSLKYPEKSSYFASQIQEIQELIKKKTK